jgi:hypothetical protein
MDMYFLRHLYRLEVMDQMARQDYRRHHYHHRHQLQLSALVVL